MKLKQIIILIAVVLILGVILKGTNNKTNLEEAKKWFDTESSETINAWDRLASQIEEEVAIEEEVEVLLPRIIAETDTYILERITQNQSLTISQEKLDVSNFSGEDEIIIEGTAGDDVETIRVEFSNSSSDFPNDDYELKTYTQWEWFFKYVASPLYKVLDRGTNEYIVTSTGKEGESITKLTIKTNSIPNTEETVTDNGSISDTIFPKWEFWEAIILDESTAYYSDLKGFEIQKTTINTSNIVCEAPGSISTGTGEEVSDSEEATHSITDFLINKYSSWVYWNTCRPTIAWKWIAFNVVRLVGDEEFKYEKHYLDYDNNLHWVLELATGTGVTTENIWAKNSEFKDRVFDIADITDTLFQEIITSNRS